MFVENLVVVIMIIVYFILYELATMSPLGRHLPHLVDNTDTVSGGPALTTDIVGFEFISFPMRQSVCVGGPVCNPFQV